MILNKEHLKQNRLIAQRIFRAKEKARKLWAKEPIEQKIKELIELQKMMVTLHPKSRHNGIIPWKIRMK